MNTELLEQATHRLRLINKDTFQIICNDIAALTEQKKGFYTTSLKTTATYGTDAWNKTLTTLKKLGILDIEKHENPKGKNKTKLHYHFLAPTKTVNDIRSLPQTIKEFAKEKRGKATTAEEEKNGKNLLEHPDIDEILSILEQTTLPGYHLQIFNTYGEYNLPPTAQNQNLKEKAIRIFQNTATAKGIYKNGTALDETIKAGLDYLTGLPTEKREITFLENTLNLLKYISRALPKKPKEEEQKKYTVTDWIRNHEKAERGEGCDPLHVTKNDIITTLKRNGPQRKEKLAIAFYGKDTEKERLTGLLYDLKQEDTIEIVTNRRGQLIKLTETFQERNRQTPAENKETPPMEPTGPQRELNAA